jgi:hypothetical protein
MRTSPRYYAVSVCAAAAMLAGCGGATSPSFQPPDTRGSTLAQSVSSAVAVHDASCQGQRSFQYIGHAQRFRVPKCTRSIFIDALGAEGAYVFGGGGGEVSATIPVTPNAKLIITVGGAGSRWHGGFNGGGAGAQFSKVKPGGGGGGASDVRKGGKTLADRVVVAGGGGGGNYYESAVGGTGGGLPDGGSGGTVPCDFSGPSVAGGGGTQSSGGAGGAGSNGGSLGDGGTGVGRCGINFGPVFLSSGGGGGYYGGGGGDGGTGGGGSGYAEPSATNVSSRNGVNNGNGSVRIC